MRDSRPTSAGQPDVGWHVTTLTRCKICNTDRDWLNKFGTLLDREIKNILVNGAN
jgi:hypothetical protein